MATKPIPQLTEKDKARFWAKVDKDGPIPEHRPELGQCWIWTASLTTCGGYGNIRITGNTFRAHRISFEIDNGPLQEGFFALHKCDNPACVRPSHLFSGTWTDNNRDMANKGRHHTQTHPENLPRGDDHWMRKNPHLIARGDKYWAKRIKGFLPRGEKNHNSKLTDEAVRKIRECKAFGGIPISALAKEFGVSTSTVHAIRIGKTWTHVV